MRLNDPRGLGLLGLGLTLMLALVGWLQYRWIGELSRADRERTTLGIERAAAAFAHDFDRIVSLVALAFVPPLGTRHDEHRLIEAYRQWHRNAAYPKLIRGIFLRSGGPSGTWSELDLGTGVGRPVVLPPDLEALDDPRTRPFPFRLRGTPGPGERGAMGPLNDQLPALVLPMRGDRRRGRNLGMGRPRMIVLWFDRTVISTRILPDLVARHFATAGEEPFRLTVVRRDEPSTAVFQSGMPSNGPLPATAESRVVLFRLLPLPELSGPETEQRLPEENRELIEGRRPAHRLPNAYEMVSRASEAQWSLFAEPPGGSVDEAVQRARRRNLGLSVGVLGLLGGALALLLVATRRIHRLARQQLDFVAGVTHELRTPIAAMRVAGQNLADGVVQEPDRVRRYGVLVEREGRRLTTMIEQVLAFAGIQAGRRTYAREALSVATVVEMAVEEMRMAIKEADMTVESVVADEVPVILGDETALVQAVRNLIENAVKYASEGGWLRVEGKVAEVAEVAILVSDHGPGIAARDRVRVFEPFVRGEPAGSATGHIGGSGLGLSLVRDIVEGHGGTVAVTSEVGRGSTFTIHLPTRAAER